MAQETAELHRCILYYPTISIPTGAWLRQSLLYWDEIGSIVPHSYANEALIPYSPDIQYLKSEGEFRPFVPDDCIFRQGYNKTRELEREFITILRSQKFQNLLPPHPERNLLSKIHVDKISQRLFAVLEREGLARQVPNDYEWYYFENKTALLYMAVLAKHIADGDIHSTVTGTDVPSYESLIFESMSDTDGVACLATNFWKALPIPRDDVPLPDIVEFKRRRRDELLNFRQVLDELQSEIKRCESQADVHYVLVRFREKSDRSLANLEAVLSDAKIATVAGSLKTLVKLDSPALWATLGIALNQATKIADVPLSWTLAGVGIFGAVEIFSYWTDRRNEKRVALRNEPFSYLAYASAEGLV